MSHVELEGYALVVFKKDAPGIEKFEAALRDGDEFNIFGLFPRTESVYKDKDGVLYCDFTLNMNRYTKLTEMHPPVRDRQTELNLYVKTLAEIYPGLVGIGMESHLFESKRSGVGFGSIPYARSAASIHYDYDFAVFAIDEVEDVCQYTPSFSQILNGEVKGVPKHV